MIPIVAIYSTFLQRAYDQVLHDVALQNLHVIFAVDRSGLNACDGETHHGIYDVSFLLPMPNLTLLSPADYNDLEKMLHYAVKECRGPVVIRYPKGVGGRIEENRKPIKTGVGIATGKGDIALVGTGRMLDFAYEVQKELRKRQKDAIVINPRFLKPLDEAFYRSCMFSCEQTVIIEESCEIGGFCTYLSTRLNDWGYQGRLMRIGLPDRVITSEDCSYVFQSCNYSPQNVADALIRSKNECPIVTPLSTVTKVE